MINETLEKSAKQKKTNYFKQQFDLLIESSKKHKLEKQKGAKLKTSAEAPKLSDDTQ
tara:strand:- start:1395 stop:1565 length:171 start_codon:yes stop_codon:yes gene_type:complete